MSRGNIVSIEPSGADSIIVTFTLHHRHGELRSYEFSGFAAASILAGGDPKDFSGTEVSPTTRGLRAFAGNLANAPDAEIAGAAGEEALAAQVEEALAALAL